MLLKKLNFFFFLRQMSYKALFFLVDIVMILLCPCTVQKKIILEVLSFTRWQHLHVSTGNYYHRETFQLDYNSQQAQQESHKTSFFTKVITRTKLAEIFWWVAVNLSFQKLHRNGVSNVHKNSLSDQKCVYKAFYI